MEAGLTEQIAAESSLELGRRSISSGFSYPFMIAVVALTTSYARDHPLFLTIAGTVMTLIGGGEVEFDAKSARNYTAAGDELVLGERARQSQEIRRIRRKLGLSQTAAARLTGGGHNAFSRYER